MYEVVQSFRSRAYGDLSVGDELTEAQYEMLSSSEKEKVKRKLRNREDDSYSRPDQGIHWSSLPDYGDSRPAEPDPSPSFGGFGGGDSGGGGASDSWSDSGDSDGGGGDGGGD